MCDEAIETIQQAKEFFRTMGCSHFHMAREYPERYEEYKRLKISQQTETEWQKEQFDEYYRQIMENPDETALWELHSKMYDLFEAIRTDRELVKMIEVSQYIRDKVRVKDRIIVAETILGRQKQAYRRSGLIYGAYDLERIDAAQVFVELALHFSTYDERENRGRERYRKAAALCEAIKFELGL